jgi:hypothetical protein
MNLPNFDLFTPLADPSHLNYLRFEDWRLSYDLLQPQLFLCKTDLPAT